MIVFGVVVLLVSLGNLISMLMKRFLVFWLLGLFFVFRWKFECIMVCCLCDMLNILDSVCRSVVLFVVFGLMIVVIFDEIGIFVGLGLKYWKFDSVIDLICIS